MHSLIRINSKQDVGMTRGNAMVRTQGISGTRRCVRRSMGLGHPNHEDLITLGIVQSA